MKLLKNIATFMLLFVFLSASAQTLPTKYHLDKKKNTLTRTNQITNGFYNRNQIDTIHLIFSQKNYWQELIRTKQEKKNIPATLIYKGIRYDSVGVRFKGMTSYMFTGNSPKKSFNLSFNAFKKKQKIEGYTATNLNNASEDPTFMREFLYDFFQQQNVPASNTNFVILTINGENWGIYTNVQQLDKNFSKEWFASTKSTRWRADKSEKMKFPPHPNDSLHGNMPPFPPFPAMPGDSLQNAGNMPPFPSMPNGNMPPFPGGMPNDSLAKNGNMPFPPFHGMPGDSTHNHGPGGFPPMGNMFGMGESSLNYLGEDTSLYKKNYTIKNANNSKSWEALINCSKALDSYSPGNQTDSLEKYLDVDAALWFLAYEIFFTDDDSYVNKGGMDYHVFYDKANQRILPVECDGNSSFTMHAAAFWSPFFRADEKKLPLLNKLLQQDAYRQRYVAHVRTILSVLNKNYTDSIIDLYSKMIENHVKTDTKKLYKTEDFTKGISELKLFLEERRKIYGKEEEIKIDVPKINSVKFDKNTNCITAKITGTDKISDCLVYFSYEEGKFGKTKMYDDATHGDKKANDGIFSVKLNQTESKNIRFYIEATVANKFSSKIYMPEGAEHDVYYYNLEK